MTTNLNITIGFSTGNSWTSKLIRWFIKSHVSHSWLAYDDSSLGLRIVLEASEKGFVAIPWERWKAKTKRMAEFKPKGESLSDSLKYIAGFLGSGYDWWAAGATGIRSKMKRLYYRLGRWIRSKFTSPDRLMCSEALVRFLGYNDLYRMVRGMDPEVTSPKLVMAAAFKTTDEMEMIYADPVLVKKYLG